MAAMGHQNGLKPNVRLGSKADIRSWIGNVRFTLRKRTWARLVSTSDYKKNPSGFLTPRGLCVCDMIYTE
jgi:hypothetical protein